MKNTVVLDQIMFYVYNLVLISPIRLRRSENSHAMNHNIFGLYCICCKHASSHLIFWTIKDHILIRV
jgi:hypothetical protein